MEGGKVYAVDLYVRVRLGCLGNLLDMDGQLTPSYSMVQMVFWYKRQKPAAYFVPDQILDLVEMVQDVCQRTVPNYKPFRVKRSFVMGPLASPPFHSVTYRRTNYVPLSMISIPENSQPRPRFWYLPPKRAIHGKNWLRGDLLLRRIKWFALR